MRLGHAVAGSRVDPQHQGVGGQQARPDAEHHPAAGHVVELDDAVGDHQRVVVRQRDDAGAEADVPGPLRRDGDEDLRRVDGLDSRPNGARRSRPRRKPSWSSSSISSRSRSSRGSGSRRSDGTGQKDPVAQIDE